MQTSALTPSMYQKLTECEKCYMQNKQLLTITLVDMKNKLIYQHRRTHPHKIY